jgi:hypothetical protein
MRSGWSAPDLALVRVGTSPLKLTVLMPPQLPSDLLLPVLLSRSPVLAPASTDYLRALFRPART